MEENEQVTSEQPSGAQSNYQETPYSDASWEIVGELSDELEFIPMNLDVVSDSDLTVDPMFSDYGGLHGKGKVKRWHLPEDLAAQYEETGTAVSQEEEVVENIVSMTEDELEAMKKEIFEPGRIQGIEETASESAAKLGVVEESIKLVITDFFEQVTRSVEETQKEAVNLSLAISKKIIDTAVEINPEYIVPVLKQALDLSGTAMIQKVRVSPQDMEFIQLVGIAKHLTADQQEWSFEADPSIKAGCVVETSSGEIDFDLDAAWERIHESVVKIAR